MTLRQRNLLLAAAACALAALALWRSGVLPPSGKLSQPPRGDAGADLRGRLAEKPRPALSNLPALAAARPAPAAAAPAGIPAARGTLAEEELAPLRRAFVAPKFAEDPRLPRERQALLSNRLLVSPETRSLPAAPSGKQTPTARNTTPFVVQFNTPVGDASRQLLRDAGAAVRGFFPNNALLAELTPEALAKLQAVGAVQAAEEFLPNDKLQPFLASLVASRPADARVRVTVQTLAPEDAEPVAQAVRAAGGEVESLSSNTRWGVVHAVLPLGAVRPLTARGEVQWIEERPPVKKRNDQAAYPSHLNATNAWFAWGLTGRGQIVGHADTGLDTGNSSTLHPDFQGNIVAVIARGRPGDASDIDGHGTHTAGSILGNGAASGGQYRGMAPDAKLVHQSVADASGNFSGLGSDLYALFDESHALGAAIHSDSWGSDSYGAYNSDCRSVDLFAWDHPDHLAVFSSGNEGADYNRNGVVDLGSVGSPATAKNVLTVGAAENDRPAGSGGYSGYTWGLGWPSLYPVAPLNGDFVSYSATLSPYRQGIAAFSSRGPTSDGRIKPDLVAPGTDVISTRSSVGDAGWGPLYHNPRYCFNGGTSMATPLVAGAAALMRQYAIERGGVTNPSAALLKAMLVGGARSLTPGQYGTGTKREIPAYSPNHVEGWGQPDLSASVHPTNRMVRLFDRVCPAPGATNTFAVVVAVSNTPLDVALSWVDYPATAGAGITLVNDLDLLVTAPDGALLYPNAGASRDTRNTVETLRVASAKPGTYQVRIIAASTPYAGTVAALYLRGAFDAPPVLVHTPEAARPFGAAAYDIDFQAQSLYPLTNSLARVMWAAGTEGAATGLWQSAAAAWLGGAAYRAQLPAQPRPTHIHYYLQAEPAGRDVRLPAGAPTQPAFAFRVGEPVELQVEGQPARLGAVAPDYGTHTLVVGAAYTASATSPSVPSNGVRLSCAGWSGTGDVPPSGSSNRVNLALAAASSLTWQWNTDLALTNRYRLADYNEIVDELLTWHPAGSLAHSDTALEIGYLGAEPYAFCGWSVDGARWPDAASTSPNPAVGIPLTRPRLAVGDYLPFWQDANNNLLSDWWEFRYFGTTNNLLFAEDDLDGDFWTNLAEFLDNTDPRDPASQPTPPAIAVNALAPFQPGHPPWTVTATVTDNLTVEQAVLFWRERGDLSWSSADMTRVSNEVWQAQLDPATHGAKRVDYYVWACDLIGYYDPQFGGTSPVYSVIGDYEYGWLSLSPAAPDIVELCDAPTNLLFTVANLAGPDLLWTSRVAAAQATFAADDAGWSHGGGYDAWCVTTNRTWNGEPVWYCGDPETRLYPNGCHATLDTPAFRVGAGGGVLFRHWIKAEPDAWPYFWDGAVLSVSTDGGATFALAEPASGYPCRIVPNLDSPFPSDQPCLAGNGEGWQTLLLDLSALAGQEVIVRFEFGADLFTNDEGWYIAGVTPFALDAPAPWLARQGAWGGALPDLWSSTFALALAPTGLAFDAEAVACVRVSSDAPDGELLVPVTVRRGHRLTCYASGPGTAAADRTFLFRDAAATVTLQAAPGAYLYAMSLNGVPQFGVYDYSTVTKTLAFSQVDSDQTLQAWFDYRTWTLTVQSAAGVPSPSIGAHTYTHGALVNASVPSPLAVGDGRTRLACSGWTLTQQSPDTGAGNAASFALTNDATLTWLWETNYALAAAAQSHGAVSPQQGWYAAGQSACVTALPASFYHLAGWQGDTDGTASQGALLTLPMTRPRAVEALFAPNLTAARQVPEPWLAAYGWNTNFEAAAEADADADGMATWKEWRCDTDPTNALSLLKLTALAGSDPRAVTWIGGVSRTQFLERAAAPAGPWQAILTNPPPTAVTNAYALPPAGPAAFYRIAVP